MKGVFWFAVILCCLTPCEGVCFMAWGDIDLYLSYKDFELLPDGSGYTFTLVNKNEKALVNSYIVVYGLGITDQIVYRHAFFVEFVKGKGTHTTTFPPSDEKIWNIRFEVYENFEPVDMPFW